MDTGLNSLKFFFLTIFKQRIFSSGYYTYAILCNKNDVVHSAMNVIVFLIILFATKF